MAQSSDNEVIKYVEEHIRKFTLQYRDPAAEEARRKKRLQKEEEMRKEILQYQQNCAFLSTFSD